MSSGLIQLQTDLKSLRYGSDKPYITKDIENPPSSNPIGMEVTKRLDDTSRMTQMLLDRPGVHYLINEALLGQVYIGDRVQRGLRKNNTNKGVLKTIGQTIGNVARIAGSTLAQVPVNGTGTHYLKGFRTQMYLQPDPDEPRANAFAEFFGEGGVEGAPYALVGAEIPMHITSEFVDTDDFETTSRNSSKYDYQEGLPKDGKNTKLPDTSAFTTIKTAQIDGTVASPIIPDHQEEEGWKPFANESVRPKLVYRDNQDKEIVKQSKYQATASVASIPDRVNRDFAKLGTPIPVGEPQRQTSGNPKKNQTTLTSGSMLGGSIPITGSYDDLLITETKLTSTYNADKPFKTTTQDNINAVQGNQLIKTTPSTVNDALISGSVEVATDAGGATKVFKDKYSKDGKYKTGTVPTNYVQGKAINQEVQNTQSNNIASGIDVNSLPNTTLGRFAKSLSSTLGSVNIANPVVNNTADRNGRVINGSNRNKKITAKYVESKDTVNETGIVEKTSATNDAQINFYFKIITPDKEQVVQFRAYIDSLDDNYTGDWGSHQYVGRAEEFYTYKGFKRDINVSFKIVSFNANEMKPMYEKMLLLAGATAPTYGGASNFMRGTLARLTIGSYFNDLAGIITSVKYTVVKDSPWNQAGTDGKGTPTVFDCSVSFKPIHDFVPETKVLEYFTGGDVEFASSLQATERKEVTTVIRGEGDEEATEPSINNPITFADTGLFRSNNANNTGPFSSRLFTNQLG